MPLVMEVDLGPGDIVLDGNPARPQRGAHHPNFGPRCGQAVAWIEVPFSTRVGLGPGHIVLHEDPAPPKESQSPIFCPCLLWPNG